MRPASARFLRAISRSHTSVVKVILTDAHGVDHELQPVEGSVTLDSGQAVRGTCDITIEDDGTKGLVPHLIGDPLTPFGSEMQVKRGVRYHDGTEELISLGFFIVRTSDVNDSGDALEVQLSGMDRASFVMDAKFDLGANRSFQVNQGTRFTDAIFNVVSPVMPGLVTNWTGANPGFSSSIQTPFMLAAEEGSDRWEFAQNLALAIGCVLYFDGDGVLTLRPAGASDSVWDIVEGEHGVILSASRNWTREGIVNRWIITGENSGEEPVRGDAQDNDPDSPTRYGGPFGYVPRFESYDFVANTDQANDVAEILKAKQMGLAQAISFGSIVNPALEPEDVVQITRARTGIDEPHFLDQVTIPLGPEETMSGTTRALLVPGSHGDINPPPLPPNMYSGTMEAPGFTAIDLTAIQPGIIRIIRVLSSNITTTINRSNAITTAGIQHIPCLETDDWATLADFQTFLTNWVAGHPDSDWWEIGNEPTTVISGDPVTQANVRKRYLRYMKAASDILDAAGKKLMLSAFIDASGGTTPVLTDIVAGVESTNLSMIDAMAVHRYAQHPADVVNGVWGMRNLFDAKTAGFTDTGLAGKPIFVTETGWPCTYRADNTNPGGTGAQSQIGGDWLAPSQSNHLHVNQVITQAQQSANFTAVMDGLKNARKGLNLRAMVWFEYTDRPQPASGWDYHCGCLDVADGKRQVWYTLRDYPTEFAM